MSGKKRERIGVPPTTEIVEFCADCGASNMRRILPWCAHARFVAAPKAGELHLQALTTGVVLRNAHEQRERMNALLAKHDSYGMSRTKAPPNVAFLFPTEEEENMPLRPANRQRPMSPTRERIFRLRRGGRFDPRRP